MKYLRVTYKNKNLEKICTNYSKALRRYGENIAVKINLRIEQIKAADNIEILIDNHVGHCHRLVGDREGQFSVDLAQPYRLIFIVLGGQIQIAEIIEIVDYH